MLNKVIRFLAPHECIACGTEDYLLCGSCAHGLLEPYPTGCYRCGRQDPAGRTCAACRAHSRIYAALFATRYNGAAKQLMHQLKFGHSRQAAEDIAAVLDARLPLTAKVSMTVTSVPTAPERVRERGFDQAAGIARYFALKRDLTYIPLLARSNGVRQTGQKREVRLRQMDGVFRVRHKAELAGRHILLVDDVVTTGATVEAAADVLLRAGATRVTVAAFARVL